MPERPIICGKPECPRSHGLLERTWPELIFPSLPDSEVTPKHGSRTPHKTLWARGLGRVPSRARRAMWIRPIIVRTCAKTHLLANIEVPRVHFRAIWGSKLVTVAD